LLGSEDNEDRDTLGEMLGPEAFKKSSSDDFPTLLGRVSVGRRRQIDLTTQDEQVQDARMAEAKYCILEAELKDVMQTAMDHIDTDWLGDVDPAPGNLYWLAALGGLTAIGFTDRDADLTKVFRSLVRLIGCFCIFLVQMFGPLLLVGAIYAGWGIDLGEDGENFIHWGDWEPSMADFHRIKTTKLFGALLLFLFQMNCLYTLLGEKMMHFKTYQTVRYLKYMTPNLTDGKWKWVAVIGAFTNLWVVVLTSLGAFAVLGASFSPRSLLFDALGLLFLYNLDDMDSDLAFIDGGDWDSLRMGWIYKEMVEPVYTNRDRGSTRGATEVTFNPEEVDWACSLILRAYNVVGLYLVIAAAVMPAVALCTSFKDIVPEGFE